jgi:HD-like signal output (HDOD) protein
MPSFGVIFMDIQHLLSQPGKLPTIPKVTQRLIASFSDEDVSIGEIADQISADPALSAKLLRLANSAYFHVSRTIGTVDDAIRMLGFVMVRNLVLGNGMAAAYTKVPGLDLPQFWRHNLYTASAARWLARNGDGNADLAFTLGLLHGLGQLQLHVGAPQAVAAIDAQLHVLDAGRPELERRVLGFDFGDVSAELALLWHFPQALADALRAVVQPLSAPEWLEAAGWVHLGAWRARAEVLGWSDAQQVDSYPAEVAERLGMAPDWVAAMTGDADNPRRMPGMKELTDGLDAMLA